MREAQLTGRHTVPEPEIIDYKGFDARRAELEGFAAAINGERALLDPIDCGRRCVGSFRNANTLVP